MASRRLANNNKSQDSTLKSVVFPAIKANVAGLSGKEKDLAEKLIENVSTMFVGTSDYIRDMTSVAVDASLNRAASLLDEVKADFTSRELEQVKTAIVEAVNASLKSNDSLSSITINDLNVAFDKLCQKIDQLSQQIVTSLADQLKTLMSNGSDSAEVPYASAESDKSSSDISGIQAEIVSRLTSINNITFTTLDAINQGFESITQLITSVEQNIIAAISGITPTKKEKKAAKQEKQQMQSMQKVMKDMAETIDKINSFVENFIDFAVQNLDKFLNAAFKTLTAFFLKLLAVTIVPTLTLIALFMHIIAEPFKKIMAPIIELVGKIMEPVNKIASGIESLLKSIGGMFDLLMKGVKVVWETVIAPMCKGFGSRAEEIGQKLGDFAVNAAEALSNFMKGFASKAEEIGKVFGDLVTQLMTVVSTLVKLVNEAGLMLIDIVKIIHAPITIIKDFFEGFGVNAKAIGEKVSEVVLSTLDLIKGILDKITGNLDNIANMIRLYVIAPLNAFIAKIKADVIIMKDKLSKVTIPYIGLGDKPALTSPSSWFKFKEWPLFAGMKVPVSELNAAKATSERPIGDLINEQMTQMQAKIDEENKAKQAAELAAKIQQKNIESMLNGIDKITDIWTIVKNIEKILVDENPETRKIADLSVKPQVDTLKFIDDINVKNTQNLNESLSQNSEQPKSKYTIDSIGDILMAFNSYAKGSFDTILEKLDNPNVVPMPMVIPGSGNNLADMEN